VGLFFIDGGKLGTEAPSVLSSSKASANLRVHKEHVPRHDATLVRIRSTQLPLPVSQCLKMKDSQPCEDGSASHFIS
jgi:hypothetical protein